MKNLKKLKLKKLLIIILSITFYSCNNSENKIEYNDRPNLLEYIIENI